MEVGLCCKYIGPVKTAGMVQWDFGSGGTAGPSLTGRSILVPFIHSAHVTLGKGSTSVYISNIIICTTRAY